MAVFEELLVNALIHRDYLVSAAIRIFIFDNRIEIISPGHLPNNLTIERIKAGVSNIRNPILVSYVAKGLLPYKGLGSGIKRAMEEWPDIEFADDRDGCLFTATIRRNPIPADLIIANTLVEHMGNVGETPVETSGKTSKKQKTLVETSGKTNKKQKTPVETLVEIDRKDNPSKKTTVKTPDKVLELLRSNPSMTLAEVATVTGKSLSAIERASSSLLKNNALRHIGPRKGGYWEVRK